MHDVVMKYDKATAKTKKRKKGQTDRDTSDGRVHGALEINQR